MNRREFLSGVAAVPAAAVFAASATAWGDEVDDTLGRITKARSTIQTLQAEFSQKRVIGLLATAVESKGKLSLVRPDRLRWELFAPDAITYWVGPDGLAIRTDEGVTRVGRASAGKFGAVLLDLMVMLGGDVTKLRSRYELAVSERDGGVRLSAKPKAAEVAKHISKLKMTTGRQLWDVTRVSIQEKSGDSSVISFGTFSKNLTIPPAYMKP